MIVLYLLTILLTFSGVQTQSFCPNNYPCAVKGFNATILCKHAVPQGINGTRWCSVRRGVSYMTRGNTSECTALIPNVQFSSAGVYKFTFTANYTTWTDYGEVTLEVGDLKVSLIRISGNGTIKKGDSLNLSCDLTCTHAPSQVVWSKNNQNIKQSGPVLHFPDLTVEDSGNYTCTWRRNENWGSDSIFLHVEDSAGQNPDKCSHSINVTVVVVVVLVVGGILIGLVVAAVIHSRRRVQTEPPKVNDSEIYENIQ